jgi:hypothetical protein
MQSSQSDQSSQSSQEMPSTVFPTMSNTPNTTLAQTLGGGSGNTYCPSADLNSTFSSYSSVRGRNESNFIYKK